MAVQGQSYNFYPMIWKPTKQLPTAPRNRPRKLPQFDGAWSYRRTRGYVRLLSRRHPPPASRAWNSAGFASERGFLKHHKTRIRSQGCNADKQRTLQHMDGPLSASRLHNLIHYRVRIRLSFIRRFLDILLCERLNVIFRINQILTSRLLVEFLKTLLM